MLTSEVPGMVRELAHRHWQASLVAHSLCGHSPASAAISSMRDPVLQFWTALATRARHRFGQVPSNALAQVVCSSAARMGVWYAARCDSGVRIVQGWHAGGVSDAAVQELRAVAELGQEAVRLTCQATAVCPGDGFSMVALAVACSQLQRVRAVCARIAEAADAGSGLHEVATAALQAPTPATCAAQLCWLYARGYLAIHPCPAGALLLRAPGDELLVLLSEARAIAQDDGRKQSWMTALAQVRSASRRTAGARSSRQGHSAGGFAPGRVLDGVSDRVASTCHDGIVLCLMSCAYSCWTGDGAGQVEGASQIICSTVRALARAGRLSPDDWTSAESVLQSCVPVMAAAQRSWLGTQGAAFSAGLPDAAVLPLLGLCEAATSEVAALLSALFLRRRLSDSVAESIFSSAWAAAASAFGEFEHLGEADRFEMAASSGRAAADDAAAAWSASVRSGDAADLADEAEASEPDHQRIRTALLPPVRHRHGPVGTEDAVADGREAAPVADPAAVAAGECGKDRPGFSSPSSAGWLVPELRSSVGEIPQEFARELDRVIGQASRAAVVALPAGAPGAPLTSAELRAAREAGVELLAIAVVILQWAAHSGVLRGRCDRPPSSEARAAKRSRQSPAAPAASPALPAAAPGGRSPAAWQAGSASRAGGAGADERCSSGSPEQQLSSAVAAARWRVLSEVATLFSIVASEDTPFLFAANPDEMVEAHHWGAPPLSAQTAAAAECVACVGLAPFAGPVHSRWLPRTAMGGVPFGSTAAAACIAHDDSERLGRDDVVSPIRPIDDWGRSVAGLIGAVGALCADSEVQLARHGRLPGMTAVGGDATLAIPSRELGSVPEMWGPVDEEGSVNPRFARIRGAVSHQPLRNGGRSDPPGHALTPAADPAMPAPADDGGPDPFAVAAFGVGQTHSQRTSPLLLDLLEQPGVGHGEGDDGSVVSLSSESPGAPQLSALAQATRSLLAGRVDVAARAAAIRADLEHCPTQQVERLFSVSGLGSRRQSRHTGSSAFQGLADATLWSLAHLAAEPTASAGPAELDDSAAHARDSDRAEPSAEL